MKDTYAKVLSELIKNPKRSDREISMALGLSQPTITRIKSNLERDGYIKEYVGLPDFPKIGYGVMAITFMKLDRKSSMLQDFEFKKAHYAAIQRIPQSIVFFARRGIGLGFDLVLVSFHPDFKAFDNFQLCVKDQLCAHIVDFNSFLINLEDKTYDIPFAFSTIADEILKSAGQEKTIANANIKLK